MGARSIARFDRAIRLTAEFSLAGAILLALAFLAAGPFVIAFITPDEAVRATAAGLLLFAAAIPIIGMPSWLLDGIFIGATQGRALRNAALISTTLYVLTDLALRPHGNLGVWIAFCSSYILRALALGWHFPALRRSLAASENLATTRASH